MTTKITVQRPTEAEVQRGLDFADAALALAGHEVTDPVLLDIHERAARGEITGDEAREAGLAHIDAKFDNR